MELPKDSDHTKQSQKQMDDIRKTMTDKGAQEVGKKK